LRDQRPEELLIGGQFHQEPTHLVHVDDLGRTQFLEPIHEVAQWPWQATDTFLPAETRSAARDWIMGWHRHLPAHSIPQS
jgi:hypothetical protein